MPALNDSIISSDLAVDQRGSLPNIEIMVCDFRPNVPAESREFYGRPLLRDTAIDRRLSAIETCKVFDNRAAASPTDLSHCDLQADLQESKFSRRKPHLFMRACYFLTNKVIIIKTQVY